MLPYKYAGYTKLMELFFIFHKQAMDISKKVSKFVGIVARELRNH